MQTRTVTVGSQQWCDDWALWYWDRACKWTDKLAKANLLEMWGKEVCFQRAMEFMFHSLMWETTEPWN